jgi:hypothetical protein
MKSDVGPLIGLKGIIALLTVGFDHGVGHSLVLLCDAKAPHGQKSKEFKGLDRYPSNISKGLF